MTLFNEGGLFSEATAGGGGGGGGTTDYNKLTNKPKVNNVELKGNKKGTDLGLVDKQQGAANQGKYLRVESSGNVGLADPQEAMSGIKYTEPEELFDVVEFSDINYDTDVKNIPTLNGVSLKGTLTSASVKVVGSNQGAVNKGKVLGINEEGNVVPVAGGAGGVSKEYVDQEVANTLNAANAYTNVEIGTVTDEIQNLDAGKMGSKPYILATDKVAQADALDILSNPTMYEGQIIEFLTNGDLPSKTVALGFIMTDKGGNTYLLTNNLDGTTTQWNRDFYEKHNFECRSFINETVDLDNFTIDVRGEAPYMASVQKAINKPGESGNFGIITVLAYSINKQTQIYRDIDTGKAWFRLVSGESDRHSFSTWEALGSGGGGTTDYNKLTNIPTLNGVPLKGTLTNESVKVVGSNQGTVNKGKVLGIDESGNVVPVTAGGGSGVIEDGSITPEKTSFMDVKLSKNIFDKTNMITHKYWYTQSRKGIGNEVIKQSNQYTSAYSAVEIPISKYPVGSKFSLRVFEATGANIVYSYYFVDDNNICKELEVNVPDSRFDYKQFTLSKGKPEGATKLQISWNNNKAKVDKDNFIISVGEEAITEYVPYSKTYSLPSEYLFIDDAMKDNSTNPVQNKVVKGYIDAKLPDMASAMSDTSLAPVQNKVIKDYVDDLANATVLLNEVSGISLVTENGADRRIKKLSIMGKTTQNGVASPENVVPFVSVADNIPGYISIIGKNLFNYKTGRIGDGAYDPNTGKAINDPYCYAHLGYNPVEANLIGKTVTISDKENFTSPERTVICFYSDDKGTFVSGVKGTVAVIPEGAKFFKVSFYYRVNMSNIQVEVGKQKTVFEPYIEPQKVEFNLTEGLRGVKSVDGSYMDTEGNKWISDEYEIKDGLDIRIIRNTVLYDPIKDKKANVSEGGTKGGSTLLWTSSQKVFCPNDKAAMCNFLSTNINGIWSTDKEGFSTYGDKIYFRVRKDRLSELTVKGVKDYVGSLGGLFIAPLKEPTYETIGHTDVRAHYGTTLVDNSLATDMDMLYSLDTRTYITNLVGDTGVISAREPKICLANNLYAVVGDTIQVFFKSVIEGMDDTYVVRVNCSKGKHYPRYWEYIPGVNDVGTSEFSLSIYDLNGYLVDTKTVKLITKEAKNPVKPYNVLCIGDSTMTFGMIPKEASRRFKGTTGSSAVTPSPLKLTNVNLVGRKRTDDGNCGWEGTGGWTFSTYLSKNANEGVRYQVTGATNVAMGATYHMNCPDGTKYIFYIQEINVDGETGNGNIFFTFSFLTPNTGKQAEQKIPASGKLELPKDDEGHYVGDTQPTITYTSRAVEDNMPFWNYDTDQWDIKPYIDRYCDGHVEAVCVLLGVNNLISLDPYTSGKDHYLGTMNDCKTLFRNIHKQYPDTKIILSTIPLPSPLGGIAANYKASGPSGQYSSNGMNIKIFKWNRLALDLMNEEEFAPYVEVVNGHAQFDSEYGYPESTKAVNTRSTTKERVQTNGVHPADPGYWQLSDALVFRPIICNL